MSMQPKTHHTPEEYLEPERAAVFKSEYFKGEILRCQAQAGVTL
jgi:hypothetical protein